MSRRGIVACLVLGTLAVAQSASASASGDSNPFGANDHTNEPAGEERPAPPDETVEVGMTLEIPNETVFEADRPADRPHPLEGVYPLPCAKWTWFEVDLVTMEVVFLVHPKCLAPLTCGTERIDDPFFGRISGTGELTGTYGDYLADLVDGVIAESGGGVTDVDIGTTNESILGALGEAPAASALATFRWCRHEDGSFERADPTWGVDFRWDTTIEDEYPVITVVAGLFDEVRTVLGLYEPDVGAAPPIERARTFVRFPTWLWVNDPLEEVHRAARSDLDLIHVEVRARLRVVRFHLGDVEVTCTPDEMRAYVAGATHPIDDLPDCHHRFFELVDFPMSTSLTYDIEQRIRQRRYATFPWNDAAWEPHATDPTVTLTSDVGHYSVRQILSLVVNHELDVDRD